MSSKERRDKVRHDIVVNLQGTCGISEDTTLQIGDKNINSVYRTMRDGREFWTAIVVNDALLNVRLAGGMAWCHHMNLDYADQLLRLSIRTCTDVYVVFAALLEPRSYSFDRVYRTNGHFSGIVRAGSLRRIILGRSIKSTWGRKSTLVYAPVSMLHTLDFNVLDLEGPAESPAGGDLLPFDVAP